MSSNTLIPANVTIRKYPKHVEASARKGAFRVYKSEASHATFQLRGEAFFATWAFASRANLDEIIAALTAIRDELVPEWQGEEADPEGASHKP